MHHDGAGRRAAAVEQQSVVRRLLSAAREPASGGSTKPSAVAASSRCAKPAVNAAACRGSNTNTEAALPAHQFRRLLSTFADITGEGGNFGADKSLSGTEAHRL